VGQGICGFAASNMERVGERFSAEAQERGEHCLGMDLSQHLYLKGNIGVSQGQLVGLEKWISANTPNWTFLLVESSNGETYHGMDAVEHLMGKGLPARTAFGNLKHEKTVEANGAFFILFLKDRKFSFYGSAAYERRGLRSKNWPGNLDREAKRSMRYLKGISRLISEKDLFLLPPSQTAVMLTA